MKRALKCFGGFIHFKNTKVIHSVVVTPKNLESEECTEMNAINCAHPEARLHPSFRWGVNFLRWFSDAIIVDEKYLRKNGAYLTEDPTVFSLNPETYNKNGKPKPLAITKSAYSGNFFQTHPLFVQDQSHHKIVFGKKEKISDLYKRFPGFEDYAKHTFNTDFKGLDDTNLVNIIKTLQKKNNAKFITIESDLDSMSEYYLNHSDYDANPIDTIFCAVYSGSANNPPAKGVVKPAPYELDNIFKEYQAANISDFINDPYDPAAYWQFVIYKRLSKKRLELSQGLHQSSSSTQIQTLVSIFTQNTNIYMSF